MALEFAKTAPGVMTANWTHPRNSRAYSVAVIESCSTWHAFIDGELIAGELPTFEEAVTAAERKLNRTTTSRLVRVAGVLVLASMLGASAVVASKFMPPLSPGEVAAVVSPGPDATPAGDALALAIATPTADEAETALAAPPQPASSQSTATADPPPAPVLVASVPEAVPHVTAPEARPEPATDRAAHAAIGMQPSASVPSGVSPAPGPRRFSAENNLLAIKEAATAATPSSISAVATPPEPIATPPAPAPAEPPAPEAVALDAEAPEAPVVSLANAAPRVVPMDPPPPAPAENASLAAEPSGTDRTVALPPIPVPAPRLAGPVAEVAVSTIARDSETAVAGRRESANGSPTSAPATAHRAAPRREPRYSERRTSNKKAAAGRTARPRRVYRPRPRRREAREQDRRIHAAVPSRRLVCFAHVCRWR